MIVRGKIKGDEMSEYRVENDQKVLMTIALKHNQIVREELSTLEISDFTDYLFKFKWKFKLPSCRSAAVNDIMHACSDDIVAFLSRQAIIESSNHELSDFKDLFEGE